MIHLKVFSISWCKPCKAIEPALQELADRGLTIVKVDVEKQKAIAEMHGVRGVPTLKLYREENLVGRHTGAMTLAQLEAFTKKAEAQLPGLT